MSDADDERSGRIFDSIIWRGKMVEISRTEERDRAVNSCEVRTLVIPTDRVGVYYKAFVEALNDFLDEGLIANREDAEKRMEVEG